MERRIWRGEQDGSCDVVAGDEDFGGGVGGWEGEVFGEGVEKEEKAKWKRTARSGAGWLPCSVTWRNEAVVLGGRRVFKGFEWVVEEVWEWV